MMIPASQTALLVMDIQQEVVPLYNGETIIESLKVAIEAARKAEMLVIYVVLSFRQGFPEINPGNRIFGPLRHMQDPIAGHIHADLEPLSNEVRVEKKRMGAFSGSDLEMILRSRGISSLILTGISTSGVVLSTVRLASDLDYRLTVLSDCCVDLDPEVNDLLLTRIFPTQAEVTTARQWAGSLSAP